MGKHSKKKRNHSSSSDSHERKRSRSKNRKRSYSNQSENNSLKISTKHHQALASFSYKYYLTNESKSIGISYAVWNICSRYAPRPHTVLILCESTVQLASMSHAKRLYRNIKVIDQNQSSPDFYQLMRKQKVEVVLTTQKKFSIIMALDQCQKIFDVIINTAKCYDTDFYAKLSESLKQRASIFIFSDAITSIKKLSQNIGKEFQQVNGQILDEDIQRQLMSDIQFMPRPSPETITKMKSLSLSMEDIAGRLFQMERIRRDPPKSLHLAMPGYITYKMNMDVQFNSLKYVWNFLRQQFPKALYEQIRGMQKYENQKGVVLNIPQQLKYLAEIVTEKLRRYRAKFKGIDLQECTVLPLIQNTESQEYKQLKQKKKYALANKNDLEIFIGGVPYQMDENSLRQFFKGHQVNLFLVRILKDEKGFSKGIGFGLCENKDHFQRAVKLNGSKLLDRTIRVRLADQRKD